MKVIILAAGMGTRLGHLDNLPKSLTELITGQSILARQLDSLAHFVSLNDVIVVVGYQKEVIMERFPDLLYLYNPNYTIENTSKSLLRALNKCHEDTLWLNGDVVFHPSVLDAVFNDPKMGMVVNISKVSEEEVKYHADVSGRILAVSKHLEHAQGEALGINFCTAKNLDWLRKNLSLCSAGDYFEKGIELSIKEGMDVWAIPVDHNLCTEIDFHEDLERANALITTWT